MVFLVLIIAFACWCLRPLPIRWTSYRGVLRTLYVCPSCLQDHTCGKGKTEKRFDRLRVAIGEQIFDPSPIKFMRISELEKLDEMLIAAYELGRRAAHDGFEIL